MAASDPTDYIIDNYQHKSNNVFYTTTRFPGKDCPEGFFEEITECCDCPAESDCTSEGGCSCLKFGGNYQRDEDGTLLLDKKKFGNVPVFECNPRCGCYKKVVDYFRKFDTNNYPPRLQDRFCTNRCVQFGPSTDLEVFDAGRKGFGLKTKRKIKSGRFICEYAGEVIGLEEAKRRQEINTVNNRMNYIFILKEHLNENENFATCVDPSHVGNIARYINHNCEPNAAIVPVRVSNPVPLLCVFAICDINEDEEISYDYGYSSDVNINQSMDIGNRKHCYCGAQNCNKWLPFNVNI